VSKPSFFPVIIGSVGGLNPAGRSGALRAFSFLMREVLSPAAQCESVVHQARLMNLISWNDTWVEYQSQKSLTESAIFEKYNAILNAHCFIRKPKDDCYFDPYASPTLQEIFLEEGDLLWPREELPKHLPPHLMVSGEDPEKRLVRLRLSREMKALIPGHVKLQVSSAGMVPDGISLEATGFGDKSSRIPRNIKLALFGASDCMKSLGLSFEDITRHIPHDQVGIYVGSCMGQTQEKSPDGSWKNLLRTDHPTSTGVPFSFLNMPADFIAAYLFGSLGRISCEVAACATFLYNLYNAIADIRSGRVQFALVGASDAPINPAVMGGYNAMRALGRDSALREHGHVGTDGDVLRAQSSIPFGENFGFTLAEGAQFVTLFHPDLALALGVEPMGAVADVFCHSDGWKDSITRPGLGNFVTFGKAMAQAEKQFGKKMLQQGSYVSAHGSSTPLNRKTEAQMFDQFAGIFKIKKWPVTAIKSYLGHTLGAASGDQVMAALGAFSLGHVPKIQNLKALGSGVSHKHLQFLSGHLQRPFDLCLVNSKGFGGHNATASVLSPKFAGAWLRRKAGAKGKKAYEKKTHDLEKKRLAWEEAYLKGAQMIHYHADRLVSEKNIESITKAGMKIRGHKKVIKFL